MVIFPLVFLDILRPTIPPKYNFDQFWDQLYHWSIILTNNDYLYFKVVHVIHILNCETNLLLQSESLGQELHIRSGMGLLYHLSQQYHGKYVHYDGVVNIPIYSPFSSFIIYSLNYFPDIFSIYLFKACYLEVTDIFHFSH